MLSSSSSTPVPDTPHRTHLIPPTPAAPPIDEISIVSQLASARVQHPPPPLDPPVSHPTSPFSFNITPVPDDIATFGDWILAHFQSVLSIDTPPGFLHDFLYDKVDLHTYANLQSLMECSQTQWIALLGTTFFSTHRSFLLEFWIIGAWVCAHLDSQIDSPWDYTHFLDFRETHQLHHTNFGFPPFPSIPLFLLLPSTSTPLLPLPC